MHRAFRIAALSLVAAGILSGAAGAKSEARGQQAPLNVALSEITGLAVVGSDLTATSGNWDGVNISYAYQWARCGTTGDACSLIQGATSQRHTATAADGGATVRAIVTATNKNGSSVATSEPMSIAPTTTSVQVPTTTSTSSMNTVPATSTEVTSTAVTSTASTTTTATTSTAITTTGAAPPIAAPNPMWSGDYETGDWSQWDAVPMTGPVSKTIVTTGTAQGTRAARFESGPSTSYTRVELQRDVVAYDEAMRLEWDQYVPSTTQFAAHASFNHLVQFHPWYDPCYGSSLAVNGLTSPARLVLRMRGGRVSDLTGGCVYPTDRTYDLGPLPRDQWLHFVLAIRWSADPAIGYLSLTMNGQQVIARQAAAVGFLGPNGERRAIHLRQGLYRFQSAVTTVVYGDGFRKYAP